MTTSATMTRLNRRTVVAVTCGRAHCNNATISTIGVLRCGGGVVVLPNATLHDNGPPYLIFGEGIGSKKYVEEGFLIRGVLLGSRLWHNTGLDVCRACTPSAKGRLSCRSTRTSSPLCRKKPPALRMRPFPK